MNIYSILAIVAAGCVGASCAPPDAPAAGGGGAPTTRPTTQPFALPVRLYQPADELDGVKKPWPVLFGLPEGTLYDPRDLTVSIEIPDGRRFTHWTRGVNLGQFQDRIDLVALWPLREPAELRETLKAIEAILSDWKIEPKGDIARILAEMKAAIPDQGTPATTDFEVDGQPYTPTPGRGGPTLSYWPGNKGGMEISSEAELHLVVTPVRPNKGRYTICMEIGVARKWYDTQRARGNQPARAAAGRAAPR